MKKDTFIKIMDAIMEYWDKVQLLENVFGCYFEDNFLMKIMDGVLDAVYDEMEGNCPDTWEPLIFDFAFNHNWGRDDALVVWIGEKEYAASTAGELYDLMLLMQPLYEEENLRQVGGNR